MQNAQFNPLILTGHEYDIYEQIRQLSDMEFYFCCETLKYFILAFCSRQWSQNEPSSVDFMHQNVYTQVKNMFEPIDPW